MREVEITPSFLHFLQAANPDLDMSTILGMMQMAWEAEAEPDPPIPYAHRGGPRPAATTDPFAPGNLTAAALLANVQTPAGPVQHPGTGSGPDVPAAGGRPSDPESGPGVDGSSAPLSRFCGNSDLHASKHVCLPFGALQQAPHRAVLMTRSFPRRG
jgi:hypothetical protein